MPVFQRDPWRCGPSLRAGWGPGSAACLTAGQEGRSRREDQGAMPACHVASLIRTRGNKRHGWHRARHGFDPRCARGGIATMRSVLVGPETNRPAQGLGRLRLQARCHWFGPSCAHQIPRLTAVLAVRNSVPGTIVRKFARSLKWGHRCAAQQGGQPFGDGGMGEDPAA